MGIRKDLIYVLVRLFGIFVYAIYVTIKSKKYSKYYNCYYYELTYVRNYHDTITLMNKHTRTLE